MLKLITDHVEANKDGEPHYQHVKLKYFLREKGYIVNHVMEIVKSIVECFVECFDKCHDNAKSETSKVATSVHADEGDHLLLDVSQILICNVWPDSTEKLFDCFKEMAIFNGVTSKEVKKSC